MEESFNFNNIKLLKYYILRCEKIPLQEED